MAGLSDVDICNQALANVGHTDFLESLDEDSTEAETCQKFFEQDRDFVLRDFRWPFATRRVAPAQINPATLDAGAVPAPWAYAYVKPPQWLFVRSIVGVLVRPRIDEEIDFVIEDDSKVGQIILANESAPTFLVTWQVTDSGKFPPDFVDALAWRIAIRLALAVRKDQQMAQSAMTGYRLAIARATANARNENRPGVEPRPRHITARG